MTGRESRARRLVLASGSPRRQQLFSLLGLPYVIKAVIVDERPADGELPVDLALRLSRAKALAVGQLGAEDLVVAADTIVALQGEVLGKPRNEDDARRMLRQLRDRAHAVYTAITVWCPASQSIASQASETVVWMRDYGDEELERYVASGDPLDKAGAYAIQHPTFDPVSHVVGCWLNVVGLPLCHLGRLLAQFEVVVPIDLPGSCRALNQRECCVAADILHPV